MTVKSKDISGLHPELKQVLTKVMKNLVPPATRKQMLDEGAESSGEEQMVELQKQVNNHLQYHW